MDKIYDVIIVGTGAAGLFAALQIPDKCKVLMITKDEIEKSNSYLAQGGISCLLGDDDYDSYFEDTMCAGRYENNEEAVRIMIRSSRKIIQKLIDYGVEFDREENGNLSHTKEGGHSTFRILYHEDVTGREITSRLIARVKERENITISTFTTMIDLIVKVNSCQGIVIENKDGKREWLFAKHVLLATGGLGGLFIHSTNYRHITGDGFAIALKNRVQLEHINYIQIHPTTLYSKKEGRRFLISESVRGEGAILLNEEKKRFVDELLPRDIVSKAIKEEMGKYQSEYVYLSLHHLPAEEVRHRFPNIYQNCLEEGYDLARDYIPVTPAQHYLMGGIQVSVNGETSMKNLYAVGEAACNGVHGANRLASNSLLESLVFAERTIELIRKRQVSSPVFQKEEKKQYPSRQEMIKEYKRLVLEEIRRKDESFYAKWCVD